MRKKFFFTPFLVMAALFFLIHINQTNAWFSFKKTKKLTAPTQPAAGPGGADYKYKNVIGINYAEGTDYEYWIFKPGNPPVKGTLPLVVFNHGWSAREPRFYQAWIDHLVKKGNVVIYPQFQKKIISSSDNFTPNALASVKAALQTLSRDKEFSPDLAKVSFIGHSEGAIVAANMAAMAQKENLPQPKAVMCVQPAASWINTKLEDLSKIPAGTLLLTIAGDKDNIAMGIDAKKIFQEAVNVRQEDKNLVIMPSDESGMPKLIADHFAPCGILEGIRDKVWSNVDALDYYGFWKLFDGLRDAAFYHKNRVYALGNTEAQKFMGAWSDGTKVNELIVVDNEAELSATKEFTARPEEKIAENSLEKKPKIFSKILNFLDK